MGIVRSLGAKLTGRRINAVSERAGMVSDRVPMKKRASIINRDRVSLVRIGDAEEPILGVECEGKAADLSHLRGVFRDGEVLDASIENGCLLLSKGRDAYWFPLADYFDSEPVYPDLKASTEFRMDPHMISDRYGKALRNGYAKLAAGYDGSGRKVVRAYIYTAGVDLMDVVTLAGTWTGEPSASRFPMDHLKDIDVFGRDVTVRMSSDYPMELITDDTVDSSYLVAPRIFGEDDRDLAEREAEKEREWAESHGRGGAGGRADRRQR